MKVGLSNHLDITEALFLSKAQINKLIDFWILTEAFFFNHLDKTGALLL